MSFSVEEALKVCSSKIAQRKAQRKAKYMLYFGNDQHRYADKVQGVTVSELVKLFRSTHAQYQWAVITPIGEPENYLRFYNKNLGKKFFSMTRQSKK